jgi:hypothetical protein
MTDKIKKADDFDRYRYGINNYVDGYKAGAAAVLTDIKNNGLDIITAAGLIKTYCKGSESCAGCPFFSTDKDCTLCAIPENWRLDHDE